MFRVHHANRSADLLFLAILACVSLFVSQRDWLAKSQAEPPGMIDQRSRAELEILPLPHEPRTQQERLTVETLIETALENNPAIGVAIAKIDAAEGKQIQAGLGPKPEIGYRGEDIGAEGTSGKQGGFVGRRFVTGGKLRLARTAAGHEVERARWQLETSRQRVINDVKAGYYDVLIAQRRLDASEELAKLADDAVRVTRILMQRGEMSEVDWRQARVEAGLSKLKRASSHGKYVTAWRRLAAVMGTPDMTPTELVDNMKNGVPHLEWQDVLQKTIDGSPEMAAAWANIERAQWALRREQAEPIPDVDVQVGVDHDTTLGETLANVEVSIPLPFCNANQGSIMQATAEYRAAQSEVRRIELSLHQRLAETFATYERARQTTKEYTSTILPEAEAALELVVKGFEAGQIDYLRQIVARRTYSQTRFAYIESLSELRKSRALIEGFLLSDSLQSGE